MSSHPVSVFDNHLIVDLIGQYLSPADVWNCARVSKEWFSLFAKKHWCSVTLVSYCLWTSSRLVLPPAKISLVQQNARWIRYLIVGISETIFLSPDAQCQNLYQLHCREDSSEDYVRTEPTALSLIPINPKLRRLSVVCSVGAEPTVQQSLISPLPRLSFLQDLELNLWLDFDHSLIFALLQHLPESLQRLTVKYEDGYFSEEAQFEHITRPSTHIWSSNRLRRLKFLGEKMGFEDLFLIPFLSSCLLLEDLTLPSVSSIHASELTLVLATHCLSLTQLQLNYVEMRQVVGMEAKFFSQMYHRFKSLGIDMSCDRENAVVRTLITHSADTLQTLELNYGTHLQSSDIVQILSSCPELRSFHVSSLWLRGGPRISVTLQDLVQTPWACSKLTSIGLAITDGNADPQYKGKYNTKRTKLLVVEERVQKRAKITQQQEIAGLILELFRKLKLETRVSTSMGLSWHGESLRMSLETGLEYMDGEMTAEDLTWMNLRWSSLKDAQEEKEARRRARSTNRFSYA